MILKSFLIAAAAIIHLSAAAHFHPAWLRSVLDGLSALLATVLFALASFCAVAYFRERHFKMMLPFRALFIVATVSIAASLIILFVSVTDFFLPELGRWFLSTIAVFWVWVWYITWFYHRYLKR